MRCVTSKSNLYPKTELQENFFHRRDAEDTQRSMEESSPQTHTGHTETHRENLCEPLCVLCVSVVKHAVNLYSLLFSLRNSAPSLRLCGETFL